MFCRPNAHHFLKSEEDGKPFSDFNMLKQPKEFSFIVEYMQDSSPLGLCSVLWLKEQRPIEQANRCVVTTGKVLLNKVTFKLSGTPGSIGRSNVVLKGDRGRYFPAEAW